MTDAANTEQTTAKKKGPAPPPENETKAQAFSRIASRRMGSALDEIRKLETLSTPANYEYTPEQVAKMKSALEAAVNKVFERFANPTQPKAAEGFQV